MENAKPIILDSRTIEIGRWKCLCMKGDGVLRVTLLPNAYKVGIHTNLPECDVASYFILVVLINKNEGVMVGISCIVLTPPFTRVIWVLKLTGKLRYVGNRARHR